MVIKQFTQDGIDLVAKMAAGVWGKEQGAHGAEVASLFCQHLTRYSLYSADLALQAEDEDGLQATHLHGCQATLTMLPRGCGANYPI